MMRVARMGWVAMATLVGGCTAGTALELAEPVRPAAPLAVQRLAVLPVTTEAGSQDAAPVVARVALDVLGGWSPPADILGPESVREHLGRAGLAATLARALSDYEATGITDADDMSAVAEALDTRYFLQLRVAYGESEVLRSEPFDDEVEDERRRDVLLVVRLWEAGGTAPRWEATARADSETGFFSNRLPEREAMIEEVARRLVERVPLEGAPAATTPSGS